MDCGSVARCGSPIAPGSNRSTGVGIEARLGSSRRQQPLRPDRGFRQGAGADHQRVVADVETGIGPSPSTAWANWTEFMSPAPFQQRGHQVDFTALPGASGWRRRGNISVSAVKGIE